MRRAVTGEARYVPAAGRAAFTGLYDPVVALTMRERRFRGLLRAQVLRERPARVVDVGCGTGTFAIDLARDVAVVGVDGDPEVLARARAKVGAERVDWRPGRAGALPVEAGGADAVTMSLLLHHLDRPGKERALADAHRVLRGGGTLHVADWGRPRGLATRAGFLALRTLDGFATTADHAAGRLPVLVAAAGFPTVTTTARLRTPWGTLELLRAARA